MKRRTYWKEFCLLILGFLGGTFYSEHHTKKPPVTTNVVIKKDSINIDTLYVKVPYKLPPLTKENLKALCDNENIYLPAVNAGYGRFWTRRPTDEQREATLWDI